MLNFFADFGIARWSFILLVNRDVFFQCSLVVVLLVHLLVCRPVRFEVQKRVVGDKVGVHCRILIIHLFVQGVESLFVSIVVISHLLAELSCVVVKPLEEGHIVLSG